MKEFSEVVKDICVGKGSRASKVQTLVKLGVPMNDARFVLNMYCPATRTSRATTARYTFGIELEMSRAHKTDVMSALNMAGIKYHYTGYNHDDSRSHYKFLSDGSLRGCEDPIECVSPVLNSRNGFASVETLCNGLNEANCAVNRQCGFHVHIGAGDLTGQEYCNVFVNYMYLENLIDTFMAPSRRGNDCRWCHSLKVRESRVLGAQTVDEMRNALSYDRYYKVNCEAYARHKTIEFRQHQGTIAYDKIKYWVMFCGKLIEWSKTHRLSADVTSIDDIEFLGKAEKTFFQKRAAHFAQVA